MEDQKKIAKAGKLICIDSGEYSDYSVIGFFVVLRDFDPMVELDEYKAAHPQDCDEYNFDKSCFLAQLLSKGLLLEINFGNLYMGSYGQIEDVSFTPYDEG